MKLLWRILGDRGFWTSFSSLITFLLIKIIHMNPTDAVMLMGLVSGVALSIDAIVAASVPKSQS